ncbi:MAG: hypothetical protein OHK0052_06970 [Anaerolineales bacterium]
MFPDPKRIAQALGKALFQSETEKPAEVQRQEAEINRDVQLRMGKARLRRHIQRQQEMTNRLAALAKRALSIGDEARFRQAGKQLLWTQQDIQRWERYLLSLDLLEARRDQARASVDLLQSVQSMTESLSASAESVDVTAMQRELELGLARAANLEKRMDIMMDALGSTLESDMQPESADLEQLKSALSGQIAAEESAQFDPEIESGLEKIRAALKGL